MSTGVRKPQDPLDQNTHQNLNLPNARSAAVDLTPTLSLSASSLLPNEAELTSREKPPKLYIFTPATARAWDQESEGLVWVTVLYSHWPWDLGQVILPLRALPAWKNRKNAAWPPSLQGLQRCWPLGRTCGQAETLSESWAPDESSGCNWTQTRSMRDRAGLGRKDPEASFHCSLLWLQAALPWGPAYWPPSTSGAFWQREQSSSVANTSRQCIV